MPESIELQRAFLKEDVSTSLLFQVPDDPAVAKAFVQGTQLPAGRDVVDFLGLRLEAEGGVDDVGFLGDGGTVSFKASASAFAGLSVHVEPSSVRERLSVAEDLDAALTLQSANAAGGASVSSVYGLLQWGYDVQASGRGSIGLGAPGKVAISADVASERLYAVVRRFDRAKPLADVLKDTVRSWAMPGSVESVTRLPPGTWLVADASGGFNATVGAELGYDFNWIKEVDAGVLEGDLGLRLKASIAAELTCSVSGRFAIVAQVLPESRVRLRLVKLRERGIGFALDVGATAGLAGADLAPESLDDLVRATLGVHPQQFLARLRKLTDPKETDLQTALADFGAEIGGRWAQDLLDEILPAVEEQHKRLVDLLKRWEALPGEVASHIWAELDSRVGGPGASEYLAEVKRAVDELASTSDKKVRAFLLEQLDLDDFFESPVGQLLGTLGGDDLLDALIDEAPLERLRNAAKSVKKLLENNSVEGALERLHRAVTDRFRIDVLSDALTVAEFDQVEPWVKKQIADFVGEPNLDLGQLRDLQERVGAVLKQGDELYRKSREMLNREYSVALSYAYQRTRTGEALIDVEFDLSVEGVQQHYTEAVRGHFDRLLVDDIAGVTLLRGSLKHRVRRERRLSISLPFVSLQEQSLNEAVAQFEAVDGDGNRQLRYTLAAEDVATGADSVSRLVLEGSLGFGAPGVVTHLQGALEYTYSYRQAFKTLAVDRVRFHLAPHQERLLPNSFDGPGSLDAWVDLMDAAVESTLGRETPGELGDTLIGLEVSVSSDVLAPWYGRPRPGEEYDLSVALQKELKELVRFYFLSDPARYRRHLNRLRAVLVYAAIPPLPHLSNGDFHRPHWTTNIDYSFARRDFRLPHRSTVRRNLQSLLPDVRDRLAGIDGFDRIAHDFAPEHANTIIDSVMNATVDPGLKRLIDAEARIVREAHATRQTMISFRRKGRKEPSKAIRDLADFGASFTRAFNEAIQFFHSEGAGRPFGTMLMVRGAQALDPSAAVIGRVAAALDVVVLADLPDPGNWDAIKTAFLQGTEPSSDQVAMRQRVVETTRLHA